MNVRRLFTTTLLLATLGGAARAEETAVTALAIGESAPLSDVKMKNVDGRELSIADVKGAKGTLVVFSCNACPWAKAWETRIVELGNVYSKRGFGVVMINSNDPSLNAEDGFDVMQKRSKERKMKFAYVVDGTSDLARAFGATRTPEVYLFGADGKLAYRGTIDDNAREPGKVQHRYLRDALDAMLAGKAVPVAETKALGCSIKFRKNES